MLLGITGSIIAFESPLDHLLHPRLSYVSSSLHNVPLGTLLAAVSREYPEDDIVSVSFSDSPVLAWQVTIPDGIVCVNPHTGQILGMRQRGETVLGFAHDLHVSLAAGSIGRTTIRWCDLASIVLLVSGLMLWWPKGNLKLHRLDGSRRSWSDLHNAIGVCTLAFLFVATGTGALISFENPLRSVMSRFTTAEPVRPKPSLPAPQDKPYLLPERALALASAALPDAHAAQITMPKYGGMYRFVMIRNDAEQIVSLNPWSGEVLDISRPANPSLADQLIATNEALHTGALFGWPGRVIMALVGLLLLPQMLTGLMMFGKRMRITVGQRANSFQKGS